MRTCLSVSLFDGWLISHELGFSFYGSLRIQQSSLRAGVHKKHKRALQLVKSVYADLRVKPDFG